MPTWSLDMHVEHMCVGGACVVCACGVVSWVLCVLCGVVCVVYDWYMLLRQQHKKLNT